MSDKKNIKFSIIVPAFNEGNSVKNILEDLASYLESNFSRDRYEILVVDDGSTDSTFERAGSVEGVKVYRQPMNLGYGAAIKRGVREAAFDWIFLMDSDGQHKVENLDEFIGKAEEGYLLVIGARKKNSHSLWWRQPGKRLINTIANLLSDVPILDINSGMRLLRKDVFLRYEAIYPNGFSITTTMTLAVAGDGFPMAFVPITTYPREGRSSNVSFIKDGINTLVNVVRAISLFNPLRVFIPSSLVCLALGLYYGITNILNLGRLSRTSIVCLMIGALLFLFGILADQLALLRRQHGISDKN